MVWNIYVVYFVAIHQPIGKIDVPMQAIQANVWQLLFDGIGEEKNSNSKIRRMTNISCSNSLYNLWVVMICTMIDEKLICIFFHPHSYDISLDVYCIITAKWSNQMKWKKKKNKKLASAKIVPRWPISPMYKSWTWWTRFLFSISFNQHSIGCLGWGDSNVISKILHNTYMSCTFVRM